MTYKIQLKRDVLANWEKFNPILADGEIGLVANLDNPKKYTKLKIGNGVSKFSELPWFEQSGSGTTDYSELENKPSINDIILQGNLSLSDLNIQEKGEYLTNEEVTNLITEALSNYYTKSSIDSQLETKQNSLKSGENIATINGKNLLEGGNIVIESTGGVTDYSELSNKPSINGIELVGNKTLSELGIQEKGDFVTNSDLTEKLSNKADKTEIPSKVSQLENDSEFQTKSQLDNAVNQKQDILVSGTNIKTINNESILGEGNITIQAGNDVDAALDENSENPVQNKVLTPLLNKLLDKIFPVTFSVTGAGNFYKGTTQTFYVRWTLKDGDSKTIYPDALTLNGESLDTTLTGKEYSNVTTDQNYKVVATYNNKEYSKTVSAKFYDYCYFGLVDGTVDETTITPDQIIALGYAATNYTQTNKSLSKEIPTYIAKKIVYAYPKSYGTLSSIKDGNGFNNLDAYTSINLEINNIEYYVYISKNMASTDNTIKQVYG